jgi:hypothetical protein
MKQLSKSITFVLMFLPLCVVGQNAHDSALVREADSQLELFPVLSYEGDAGQVWHDTRSVSLDQWKANGALGLRFKMDLFIVTMDLGFSEETTGFYLNFGQLF